MEKYIISGSYRSGKKIIEFSKEAVAGRGIISGSGIEGKIEGSRLEFRTDNLEFRFTERLKGEGFVMYSGAAYLEGLFYSDALAGIKKQR